MYIRWLSHRLRNEIKSFYRFTFNKILITIITNEVHHKHICNSKNFSTLLMFSLTLCTPTDYGFYIRFFPPPESSEYVVLNLICTTTFIQHLILIRCEICLTSRVVITREFCFACDITVFEMLVILRSEIRSSIELCVYSVETAIIYILFALLRTHRTIRWARCNTQKRGTNVTKTRSLNIL